LEEEENSYYDNSDRWQAVVDKYIDILFTAKSFREVAAELGEEPQHVRRTLKRLEKEGLIRCYVVGKKKKKVYIRKFGDGDWKKWI
jgi:DNA-binding MarR family transcriptional regulator